MSNATRCARRSGYSTGVKGAPATPDQLDQLKKLAELRDMGALTDDEFETQKAKILAE